MLKEIIVIMLFGKENVKMDKFTMILILLTLLIVLVSLGYIMEVKLPNLSSEKICHINNNGHWQSDCYNRRN